MSTQFDPILSFIRELFPGQEQIPLHKPDFGPKEERNLLHCLQTTDVAGTGSFTAEFENKLGEFTGAQHVVAMVNGTSALHLVLHAIGVSKGDIVLTQSLSFVATRNAILYNGAEPLYFDVDPGRLSMNPDLLAGWLKENARVEGKQGCYFRESGQRIAACLPMHSFGIPARIEEISEICTQYHIPLVEDAAESLGSFSQGKHTGTFGKAGILSFNGNKIITTGGGGAVITHDGELAAKLRHLAAQAKKPHPFEYIHDEAGYNYRMPNINAALGSAQMDSLEEKLASKRWISSKYQSFFEDRPEAFLKEPEGTIWNSWLNAIFMKDERERNNLIQAAHEKGIFLRPAWQPMHILEDMKYRNAGDLEVTMQTYYRLVNLPSSPVSLSSIPSEK